VFSALELRFGRLRYGHRRARGFLVSAPTWDFDNSRIERRRTDAALRRARNHLQQYEE